MAQNQAALTIVGQNGHQDTALTARTSLSPELLHKVLMEGDLSKFSKEEQMLYVLDICQYLKLNPATRPFILVTMDKKLVLYATKDCAEQLRNANDVSTSLHDGKVEYGVYTVKCIATARGRREEAIGAVPFEKEGGEWESYEYRGEKKSRWRADGSVAQLSPIDRANAIKKAETQAKRRATFGLLGLSAFAARNEAIEEMEDRIDVEILNPELEQMTAAIYDALPETIGPGAKPEGVSDATYENYAAVFSEARAAGIDIEEYRLADEMTVSMIVAQGKHLRNAITAKKQLIPEGETASGMLFPPD